MQSHLYTIVCSGGSTDSTTAVSVAATTTVSITATTVATDRQEQDHTALKGKA